MKIIKSINLFALIAIPLSLWLGFTGRVDWWVITFVWLMKVEISLNLRR